MSVDIFLILPILFNFRLKFLLSGVKSVIWWNLIITRCMTLKNANINYLLSPRNWTQSRSTSVVELPDISVQKY